MLYIEIIFVTWIIWRKMMKIILSADGICDLPKNVLKDYNIETIPYHIIIDGKEYFDNVNIYPKDIYEIYNEKNLLPKTSSINVIEYMEYFKKWIDEGYQVIHFCLGSSLTSSYQNCRIAAEELGNIKVIDSGNLSSAVGLQLMDCRKMIDEGIAIGDIEKYFNESSMKYHGGFVLNSLEFLKEGGRCSALAAYGASLLNLKLEIIVDNSCGSMKPGTKYRGSMERVIPKYIRDTFNEYKDIRKDVLCITHSGIEESMMKNLKGFIEESWGVEKIHICKASSTISSHCGPGTFGLFFATQDNCK